MAKITFVILAHENATHVAELARLLTAWDDHAHAVIHYDLKSPKSEFERLKSALADVDRAYLVPNRIKCGWGDFSLVDATVQALKFIRKQKIDCERVFLLSGACMPIRPLRELSQFLDAHPHQEFIESFDASWISGGLRHERYQYWHLFNFQTQYWLFHNHYNLQQRIMPKRRFPRGLEPRFGSQWWCLSWELCEKILDYIRKHPFVYFFFSTTWIPDESFFQTMAYKFVPHGNLARRNLTFFHFNDWGKPVIFLDEHASVFKEMPFFFARKISGRAAGLRAELKKVAMEPAPKSPPHIAFRAKYTFPYEQLLASHRPDLPLMPAPFQAQDKNSWEEMLGGYPKSFAILYGPPALTRRAANALAGINGLTVFGRLFKRDTVDFGPNRTEFKGLRRIDNRIRDFDPAGYFRRILNRCETIPVFELTPGDAPAVEAALLKSPNAILLPILPDTANSFMRQIYRILCVDTAGKGANPPAMTANADIAPILTFRAMTRSVDAQISLDQSQLIETILRDAPLFEAETQEQWIGALEFQHGKSVLPLTTGFDAMAGAIEQARMEEVMEGLPADWRQSLATLAPLNPGWRLVRLGYQTQLLRPRGAQPSTASAQKETAR